MTTEMKQITHNEFIKRMDSAMSPSEFRKAMKFFDSVKNWIILLLLVLLGVISIKFSSVVKNVHDIHKDLVTERQKEALMEDQLESLENKIIEDEVAWALENSTRDDEIVNVPISTPVEEQPSLPPAPIVKEMIQAAAIAIQVAPPTISEPTPQILAEPLTNVKEAMDQMMNEIPQQLPLPMLLPK